MSEPLPLSRRLLVAILWILTLAAAMKAPALANDAPASTSFAAQTGRPTVSIGHTQSIAEAVISPDRKKLFTMDFLSLRAWDIESGRELGLVKGLGYGTNSWRPAFSAKRKWMLVPLGNIRVFNYDTLQELPEIKGMHSPAAVYWDDQRDRGYFVDVRGRDRNRFAIGEIVPRSDGAETTIHVIVTMTAPPNVGSFCRGIFPLDDKRLFVDTTFGYFIIDRDTWEASRPDVAPSPAGDELVSGLEQALPRVTFPLLYTGKEYELGPENTVIGKTFVAVDKATPLLEVLSAKDLSVLRSVKFDHGYASFTGPANYDAKARLYWVRTGTELVGLDFDTLAVREKHHIGGLTSDTTAADRLGGYMISAHRLSTPDQWLLVSDTGIWRHDTAVKKPAQRFGDRVAPTRRIVTSPTGFDFLLVGGGLKSKRVRILPNGLDVSTVKASVGGAVYDPAGETLTLGNAGTGSADVFDLSTWPKVDFRVPQRGALKNPAATNIVYSDDGTVLVMHSDHGVGAVDMTNGDVLLDEKLSHTFISNDPHLVAISPDKRWVIAFDGQRKFVGFDLSAPLGKRRAWEKTLSGYPAMLSFIGDRTLLCTHNGDLEYRDAFTGEILASIDLPNLALIGRANALSKDKKQAAICTESIKLYEVETGRQLWEIKTDSYINSAAFFANSRYLITVSVDNLLRLWDTQEKRELCTLALFEDNDEWVVSSGDLRFDASDKAIDKMYVVKGTDIIPLESLFEKLYTPKLLATLLAGEKLEPPAVDLAKLIPPPNVRLEFAEVTRNLVVEDDLPANTVDRETIQIRATAQAPDSGLRELRLFQNGKLVATAPAAGTQYKHPFDVGLVPGDNVFRVVATNEQGTESRPAEVAVTYRPKPSPGSGVAGTQSGAGLQLHLLIVGVDVYKNSKYNLNYAVADATAVRQKIEAQTKSIFTGVNVKFILNEQAQKSSITDAFRELSTKAGPRDVFIFYYAGHGVMTSDAKPEFFLVPHDVTQLYGADDALRQKGLSSAELLELSKLMPAQKQLFILDACQSAGALTTIAMRGAAEEKAIAQLARSSGTHWLTASGSEQFATEFATLGHGAFTYALLEGLSGRADTGDGRITVNELNAFLQSEVPEITQKHKGTPQFPSSYGFGQDFPVAVIAR